jgi:hypothetical protein
MNKIAKLIFLGVCIFPISTQANDIKLWLDSSLYGNDNELAALKPIKIKQADEKYTVEFTSNLGFVCVLTFNEQGQPATLSACAMAEPEPPYWQTEESIIPLKCVTKKKEIVCRGNYTIQPIDARDFFTIARKR